MYSLSENIFVIPLDTGLKVYVLFSEKDNGMQLGWRLNANNNETECNQGGDSMQIKTKRNAIGVEIECE